MNEQAYHTDIEPEIVRKVLAVAALFDEGFNIDWLQELTNEKTSMVFGALDIGIQNKWLSHKRKGFFLFHERQGARKACLLLAIKRNRVFAQANRRGAAA